MDLLHESDASMSCMSCIPVSELLLNDFVENLHSKSVVIHFQRGAKTIRKRSQKFEHETFGEYLVVERRNKIWLDYK